MIKTLRSKTTFRQTKKLFIESIETITPTKTSMNIKAIIDGEKHHVQLNTPINSFTPLDI